MIDQSKTDGVEVQDRAHTLLCSSFGMYILGYRLMVEILQ